MPPLTVMIKPVSSACNMTCGYCFYADISKNRQQTSMGRMSRETLENVVRRALAYGDGQVSFAFQGGEPTLAGTDFFESLIHFQKKYNTRGLTIQNSLQTNAYHLEEDLLDLLVRENFLVGVSFDGTPALHDRLRLDREGAGTAGAVERTIGRLQRRGVDFNILCVVTRHVALHPEETFAYLSRYGFLQFIPCLDPFDGSLSGHSLTAEDYGSFLKKIFDLYEQAFQRGRPVSVRVFDNFLSILMGLQAESCGMQGRCTPYYLIEADGSVYPCDFYVLDQWRMGNINDSSFFRLEQSPVARQFIADSLPVSQACAACRWKELCRGGCRRDREPFADGLPGQNRWCASYQALFEYAGSRMARMAQALSSGTK